MIQQMVFDLIDPVFPAFEEFIVHRNREVLQALLADEESFMYLWGGAGSGKTHLLKAWVFHHEQQGRAVLYVDAARESLPEFAREASVVAVDHLDVLDPDGQIQLFSIYHSFKMGDHEGRLLMAGSVPPSALDLRDDVRSRVAWGLVLQVHPLSDQEKIDALVFYATRLQIMISREVFEFLLEHQSRDLKELTHWVDVLNRYSLTMHRPVSVPMARRLLRQVSQYKESDVGV